MAGCGGRGGERLVGWVGRDADGVIGLSSRHGANKSMVLCSVCHGQDPFAVATYMWNVLVIVSINTGYDTYVSTELSTYIPQG